MSDEIRVYVVQRGDRDNLVMRYRDPVSNKVAEERSTGTPDRKEAWKRAGDWQAELNDGRYCRNSRITWDDFRLRYEEEKLSTLAENTQAAAGSAMNHLERVLDPERLSSLTSEAMSRFQARLRREGMKQSTIAVHLRHLRAVLNWAVSMGLLTKKPRLQVPRPARGSRIMRGRPVTAEEFDRMLAAVPKVRKHDPGLWQRYLRGLWLSGLRLQESLALSWDPDAAFAIDLGGRHPRFRIYAEAEKGHQDRYLPMTPDFAEWILQTPEDEREGVVFRLEAIGSGHPLTGNHVGRIVSAIGEKAGVVVNKAEGKFATAHDLRRSFGTRWAPKVKPVTLQRLMRHKSLETTLRYYVDLDADELADELWASHRPLGDISGDMTDTNVQKREKGSRPDDDGNPFSRPR